jgi:hypothetical protein
VQWEQAGDALYQFLTAVNKVADDLVSAKSAYGQFEEQLYGDKFLQSISGVISAEQQQIDKANELAKAAGFASASQQDLAMIITAGSLQMQQAVATLSSGIIDDINAIYGAKKNTYDPNSTPGYIFAIQDNKNALNLSAMQDKARKDSAALDLIQKLGDLEFITKESTADVLKTYGLTPEQLGKTLGISGDLVSKDIEAAAKQAESLTDLVASSDEQSGLLQDILAAIQGKPLPYDLSQLIAPTASASVGGKPGGPIGGKPPGGSLTEKAIVAHTDTLYKSSATLSTSLDNNTAAVTDHTAALRGNRYETSWPRNTRTGMPRILQP